MFLLPKVWKTDRGLGKLGPRREEDRGKRFFAVVSLLYLCKKYDFLFIDLALRIKNDTTTTTTLLMRKLNALYIFSIVICRHLSNTVNFYLKMADDASSSSGCTGNLVDNSINQDELIMKQQREIEKEVTSVIFLVQYPYLG